MSLKAMIDDAALPITEIGAYLDGLDHAVRKAEVLILSSRQVKELYHRAAAAEPLTLDFFVPEDVAATTEVIHHGRNSLPAFNFFQKRFARSARSGDRLFGYNEQSMRWATGPGFFVALESRPEWRDRGAVVIDYHQVPGEGDDVPAGWPKIVPNSRGLQFLIYHKTRDFMRKVSSHVSVGAAYKGESDKEMGAYFALCRDR